MADIRVPRTTKPTKSTKRKSNKVKAPRVLYTLSADELHEYQNRHRLLLSKQMEFHAASNYLEIFENALIAEHGLPIKFSLNIETGKVTEVELEAGTDAQNGRV